MVHNPLVLASSNLAKLQELSALLAGTAYSLRPQSAYQVPEADETGTTYVENAIIKARNATEYTGFPALADDSGIEVDALKGAPGVRSARFSGAGATDETNNALLVEKLRSFAVDQCSARYRTVIVLMRHAADPAPVICEGSWEGVIRLQASGTGGFGYDPYFYLPEHHCTSAELSAAEKNRLSHRSQALQQLKARLSDGI